jgi:hypothetical protein
MAMENVLRPNFSAQVVHAVDPDDEEWSPLCKEKDPSFVADMTSKLKLGFQWCPRCNRIMQRDARK